jgi:tetratricopeptide (TPR) repeat protein
VVHDDRGTGPPDPADAADARAFVAVLRRLRVWAGQPSLRRLERLAGTRRTARGDVVDALPTSTTSTVLRRDELPRWEFVAPFVAACLRAAGLNDAAVEAGTGRWQRAWRRLAEAGMPAAREPPAVVPDAVHQLPADIADFTGRDDELRTLAELLPDETTAATGVCVIQGMAGVGKTRLAVHAAHRMLRTGRFTDAIYVDLYGFDAERPPARPEAVLEDLLRLLGIPPERIPADPQARAAAYRDRLHGRSVLLVLDDAADERPVDALLPDSPRCLVLVTSRRRLAIDGAYPLALEPFSTDEAVDLLSRVAGPARVTTDPGAARQVTGMCGRLPLAVALAARRLQARPAWTLADLARRLGEASHRLGELTAGTRAVRTAFDLSYRSLPTDQARLLRLLAHHPGPDATAASAAALAGLDLGEAGALLEALLDEHLLQQDQPDRYHFHDLIRAYAAERVTVDDDLDAAVRHVITWYVHAADSANRLLFPLGRHLSLDPTGRPAYPAAFGDHHAALEFFEAERANLIAAVTIAAQRGLAHLAWQLPAAMWGFFNLHKYPDDWLATHRTALVAARAVGDQNGQATTLTTLAIAHVDLHQPDQALGYAEEAVQLRRATGDRLGQGISLTVLGIAHDQLGDTHQALDCHHRALEAYRDTGDLRGEALTFVNLADVHRRHADHPPALAYLQQALRLQQQIGDTPSRRLTLAALGDVHHDLGDHTLAVDYYEQALAISRELDDRATTARTLAAQGHALAAAGAADAARRAWQEALALYERLGQTHTAHTVRDALDALARCPE